MPSHPCRLFRGANKINPEDTGMHSFQTCNDLVMCALRDDSVGIGRIPAGFQCTYFFSWNHDTAQFPSEYSPDGRLFACWSDTGFLVQVWDTRTGQPVGKFPTFSVHAMTLSPTLIQHSPGDRLIALWHRFRNTISIPAICSLARIHIAFIQDGTKLAYCPLDFGLRIWDIAGLTDEYWHSDGYELKLQGMTDGRIIGWDNGLLFPSDPPDSLASSSLLNTLTVTLGP